MGVPAQQPRGYKSKKDMGYVNFSIHLPSQEFMDRIKAAAKEQGISPGAFIRTAAEKAVVAHEKRGKKRVAA